MVVSTGDTPSYEKEQASQTPDPDQPRFPLTLQWLSLFRFLLGYAEMSNSFS